MASKKFQIDKSGQQSIPQFSKEEISRYSRHLILPEVGLTGQKKLKGARVLIVGAGGLGAPLSMYLAAAGVGNIGLVDFDVVDPSNLQRQLLYSVDDIGKPKVEAAKARLKGINPHVEVTLHNTAMTSQNALDIIKDYHIVVDGSDNFATRYLVNDACVLLGKPNVYGSVFRFDGQVSVFDPQKGPCYRCLYPEPPPPELAPNCSETGVLGILPGIIGTLQALETIKLIIGKGEPLIGRLVVFDALQFQFQELKLGKNPHCSLCGNNPSITELIDYQQFCGAQTHVSPSLEPRWEITVEELKQKLDNSEPILLLDVREPQEYEICNLGGLLIPQETLPQRLNELNPSQEIIVHCRTGIRSAEVVSFLREAGFENVKNLTGGIWAWADRIDLSMPKY